MTDFSYSFDVADLDVGAVHAFLASTYWSPGIAREVVERAIANSLCIGVRADDRQVAFARLVTDRATFAYLADVFVLPELRGQGVSREMLSRLMAHPEVQGLRRIMLVTRDAHGLYEKLGFTPLKKPQNVMELHRPNVYAEGNPTA